MPHRREDDRPLKLVIQAAPDRAESLTSVAGLGVGEYEVDLQEGALRPAHDGARAANPAPALFLIDGGDEAILVLGVQFERIPRAELGSDLRGHLLARAAAWHRASLQRERQTAALKEFILLAERLNRVESGGEVFEALGEHTPRILRGCSALLFSRLSAPEAEDAVWRLAYSRNPIPEHARVIPDGQLLSRAPALISADDPTPAVAPILAATGATALAYAGIGDLEILFVVERRSSRTFDAEDWYHLRLIARQAEVALSRVRVT